MKLLGERLVAFRDTQGRIGLIDEFCAHRGVSLWFGRNEECGLRCPYHGWKYDVTGQCVDLPSEGDDGPMRKRMKLKSYPCIEQGGVIWTYMGPPELKPAPPALEWVQVPPERRFVSKRLQECNYLQALEGGIDSSHVSFLHSGALKRDPLFVGSKGNEYNEGDKMPQFDVVDFEGGLLIGARRNAENDRYYWRITPWIMPWHTIIPPRAGHPLGAHAWVPIDDENCWAWSINYHPKRALTEAEADRDEKRRGHPREIRARHLHSARQQDQRLPDRPRGAESGRALFRRRRHRHAGRLAAGIDGADPGPHAREPVPDRPRHRAMRRMLLASRRSQPRRPTAFPASIPPSSTCARARSCCRATSTSRSTRGTGLFAPLDTDPLTV